MQLEDRTFWCPQIRSFVYKFVRLELESGRGDLRNKCTDYFRTCKEMSQNEGTVVVKLTTKHCQCWEDLKICT